MKSEAEIRKHLGDLRVALTMPCDCTALGHGPECRTGMMMMRAAADTLAWALGENEGMAGLVERMAADVARHKAGG